MTLTTYPQRSVRLSRLLGFILIPVFAAIAFWQSAGSSSAPTQPQPPAMHNAIGQASAAALVGRRLDSALAPTSFWKDAGAPSAGQVSAPAAVAKARLAIRKLAATDSVQEQAKLGGQEDALKQILDATDSQLLNSIEQTRKFTIVARKDLGEVMKERDLRDSGLVDKEGSGGGLKDAGYVLTMTIDNFQDVTTRATLEGQLGETSNERREIQIQAVVKIFDSTGGTLLRSSSQSFTKKQTSEVPFGQARDGRATNALLGEVAKAISVYAANQITDFIYPSKVMAFTGGVLTFNRTKESGVEAGQWWEAFAPGKEMIDPDTGEALGAEEIHIAWAKVTDAGAKFSKAQVYGDNGISCGSILRRKEGPPDGADKLERSSGSCEEPRTGAAPTQPAPSAQAQPTSEPTSEPTTPRPAAGSSDGAPVASASKPLRMAIFVKNREKKVKDEHVMVLEDAIVAAATSPEIEIIAREDVVNAVSRFAKEGANKGTDDPKALDVDKVLSDSTSASNLARNMGADAVLLASITSLTTSEKRIKDADLKIDRTTHEQKLTLTYRILDGATGGALAASDIVVRIAWQTGGDLEQEAPPIEDLLHDAGKQLAEKMRLTVLNGRMRKPSEQKEEVAVAIRMSVVDLSVPEIVIDKDGKPVITSGSYKLEPMAVSVYVDGLLIGTAPGEFKIAPGIHRIKCERPLFKTYEGQMSARSGLQLTIPMQLTDDGLARLKDNARFFQDLKERAIMTQSQAKLAEGYAEFLKNSSIKIDTSNVTTVNGQSNYWAKLFR